MCHKYHMRRRCIGVYAISEWKRSPPMMCGSGYNAERAGSRPVLEMLLNHVHTKNGVHLIENVMLYPGKNTSACSLCGVYIGG
jgi:hypothetical protein